MTSTTRSRITVDQRNALRTQVSSVGKAARKLVIFLSLACSGALFAHGDVTPQAVDTKSLPALGKDYKTSNPYRGNKDAIVVGDSAYNQNCARCHGLQAISGGIAPDLRKTDADCFGLRDAAKLQGCVDEIDDYFATSVRRGKVRNGAVYMPPFEDTLQQEAVWAIKAYLETRRVK
jgi:cytochrome c-550 PedF